MKYLELSGFFNNASTLREVSKKELLARADATLPPYRTGGEGHLRNVPAMK